MVGKFVALLLLGASSCLAINSPKNHSEESRVIGSVAKHYPGDVRYPNNANWLQLELSLPTGKLHHPRLFWTGRYERFLLPNCADGAYESDWQNDPFSIRSQWFAGLNCDACPAHYAQNTCSLGNLPNYVVEAKSAQDVSAAVQFADRHNLRLVVKNTGHDFMGRNLGWGGLSVWTHRLKSPITFTEAWMPTAGNRNVPPQSAVIYGSGWQWRDLYAAAGRAGKFLTGGTDGSVGAGGGWLLGGGHGPFTNIWGLGSDNVLELEVVIPSTGQIVVANEYSYPDLFWALRGGGGSTFGIVTKVTMKAHPQVSMNAIRVTIRPKIDVETDEGKAAWARAMAYVLTSMPNINDFGLSGHPIMQSTAFDTLWSAPGKSTEDINNFIEPYMEKLREIYGVSASYTALESDLMTMMTNLALIPNNVIPNRDPEGPSIMASRLLGRRSLSNFDAVERVMRYLFDQEYICEPFNVGGRAAANKWIRSGLNPAWRDSIIHFSILPTGQGDMDTVGKVRRGYANLDGAIKALDGISENSASYLNEGSWNENNWQLSYWGSNYPKLLEVKRRYDPNSTLWCFPCVGAEIFTQQADGKLYYYTNASTLAGTDGIGAMNGPQPNVVSTGYQQSPDPSKAPSTSARGPVPARPKSQRPQTPRPQLPKPNTPPAPQQNLPPYSPYSPQPVYTPQLVPYPTSEADADAEADETSEGMSTEAEAETEIVAE